MKITTIEQRLERLNRINQLGGFGSKRTQVVRDVTKYSRKIKHPKGANHDAG